MKRLLDNCNCIDCQYPPKKGENVEFHTFEALLIVFLSPFQI